MDDNKQPARPIGSGLATHPITTPFITAALAGRDRRAADPGDVSPFPEWYPQPDMLPAVDWRDVDQPEDFQ